MRSTARKAAQAVETADISDAPRVAFPATAVNDPAGGTTQITHWEIGRLIERAHRRFLDVLRAELTRLGVDDISPSQVMLLFTIGNDELSVRDLLERGHYLGSNASYNLKQLVDAGYVHRTASQRDRRSARLRLSEKAQDLCDAIRATHDSRQISHDDDQTTELGIAYGVLRRLELLWTGSLR